MLNLNNNRYDKFAQSEFNKNNHKDININKNMNNYLSPNKNSFKILNSEENKINSNDKNNNKNNSDDQDSSELVEIPDGVKYGIDETGNPLNISKFFEEENNNKQLIAFIIQKQDKNNYLVDIKGNVLEKKEDGDYLYKDGDTYVVIKDFDVKHPDQKIPTHRSFIRREKTKKINDNEDVEENIDFNNKINDIKNRNNLIRSEDISDNHSFNLLKERKSIINNNSNYNINNNYGLKNLFSSSRRTSSLKNENNNDIIDNDIINYKKRFINSRSFIEGKKNNEYSELMSVWRERYGKENLLCNSHKNIKLNNYSYNKHKDRILERTNSILKMAEKYKENINIPNNEHYTKSEVNYRIINPRVPLSTKIKISLYHNNYNKKKFINPLIRKSINSHSHHESNINNPLLKKKMALKNGDNYINKIENITKNILNKYKFNINKTYEIHDFKNKENQKLKKNLFYKKNYLSLNNNKINHHIRNNFKKNAYHKINIKNKEKKRNNYSSLNDDSKNNSVIKDYIYSNITRINEKNKSNKIFNEKYSVLSKEANKIIKDYSIKLIENEHNLNKKKILINTTFNNENYNNNNFTSISNINKESYHKKLKNTDNENYKILYGLCNFEGKNNSLKSSLFSKLNEFKKNYRRKINNKNEEDNKKNFYRIIRHKII